MRLSGRFKLLCHALILAIVAAYLVATPPSPAAAATPVAVHGAGPVNSPLPATATPNHGLAAGQTAPPVPPSVAAAGPAKVPAKALQKAAAELPFQPIARPGFLLGDTSLVVYWDAEVDEGNPDSWGRWFATVTDTETHAEQRSAELAQKDLSRCYSPALLCRSFGAADGWVLDPARTYTVTVTEIAPDGTEQTSKPSEPAHPRKTDDVPALPAGQAAGCGCATVLGPTVIAQALRGATVNTATGAYLRVEQDFAMPSYGIPFNHARYYSSGNTATGMFGAGWSSSYDIRVIAADNGAVRVRAEDGSEAVYLANADGSFDPPTGVRARLTKVDGGWQLVPPDRRVLRFDSAGRLLSIKNARGLGVTLAYTSGGLLSTITDAGGRVVRFESRADLRLITKITLPDGRSTQFDYQDGRLLKTQDPRGYVTSYAYDAGGRLAQITDARGHQLIRNTYDAGGRVAQQLDPEGAKTTFAWDAVQQVARTTDPDGVAVVDGYKNNVLLYSQNAGNDTVNHRYTGKLNKSLVIDPKGNQEETRFDDAGNPVSRTAPEPFSFTQNSTFDDRSNLTAYQDGRGNTWKYEYNEFNEMVAQRDPKQSTGYKYEYDAKGQVITRTDPRGKVTRYEYDANGDRTAEIAPTGRRTEMTYDVTGRLASVVDPRGTVSGGNKDAYRTKYVYDAQSQITEVWEPGKAQPYRTTYDELGNVVVATDPLSNSSHYTYDNASRRTVVKDPIGNVTTSTYTPGGRRASVADGEGNTTSWTYDVNGRVATETSPRGNADAASKDLFTAVFHYDFNGNLIRADRPYGSDGQRVEVDTAFDALDRPTGQQDQFKKGTTVSYDNNGNVVEMTNERGEKLTNTYDEANRRTGSSGPEAGAAGIEYDDAGNPIKETTPTGGVVTTSYDDDGRVAAVTEPRGNVSGANPDDFTTRYTYDQAGNPATVTDALGSVGRVAYDALNRPTAQTDANGNTTRFGYDDADRLVKVTGADAPGGQSLTYTYDADGQVIKRTDPLGRVASNEYDRAGRTTVTTDPLGRRREYVYDPDSNLIQEVTARIVEPGRPDPNRPARSIFYAYDNLGRLTSKQLGAGGVTYTYGYDAKNRLVSAADPAGVQSFKYDDTDRLTSATRGDDTFKYDYDRDDRVTGRTYPDGTHIGATYDDGDRIKTLTASRGDTSAEYKFSYDVADNLTGITYPASTGITESRDYDRAGRMTRIAATKGDTTLSAFDLSLDKVGNPTKIVQTTGEPGQPTVTEATAYTYDAANRLTAECFGAQACSGEVAERTDYTYDLVGNRTKMTRRAPGDNTTTNYTYDGADQLTQESVTGSRTSTRSFAYDLEGNQTRAGSDSFAYALDHTMTSATTNGTTTNYAYDGAGNRISAVSGSTTQTWTWDINADRPLLAQERQTDATGTIGRDYLYDPSGQPLALLVPGADTLGAHSYLRDWLGGVSAVVSPAGAPEWSYDYDAFGVSRGTKQGASDAPANPLQYAGTYQDTSQGDRYAMGARSYDPSTGRFASADPVAQPATDQAVSTYSYTNGRPTVLTDPSGGDPDDGKTGMTDAYVSYYSTCANNPAACAATTDANTPAGGDGEQQSENPDWLNSKKIVDEADGFVKQIGDEIVNLILDLVGFNDAKACITEGDIVACISTALQAVPWGKMFKAAKVAIKAIGVGRRLIDAYSRLKSAKNALVAIPRWIKKATRTADEAASSKKYADEAAKAAKGAKDAGGKAKATSQKAADNAKRAKKKETSTGESCKVAQGNKARLAANSFAAGTEVLLADGSTKPIEKLHPGDTVTATDPATGQTEPEQVTATVVGHGDKDLIDLTLAGAGAGGGGPPSVVTATAGHKFYSLDRNDWVTAASLKPGETLRDATGHRVTVVSRASRAEVATVYNLTVSEAHTYYVVAGDTPVLVHNCQVDYGDSDLSRSVMQERLRLNKKGNNFAAARYVDDNGVERIAVAYSSKGLGNHAERKLMRQFGDSIKEMYSEFQPCTGTNKCRKMLGDAGIPTSYSWSWTTSAEGAAARKAKKTAIDSLFADALNGIW
ncbi:nucleic acid/nucleotide deaminase domain-containing protein [Paractinoplanes globisporus]|uniref:Nucleic acid/nucleotide deaminase domain-containing protein n=1 Tax=Paractinoplanes globisporus TaxID=113565 RepID=A0ABW6WGI3_9ACTN|nr:nucleic acid/nucleotide deaminase domain-containing protein [Actinoplanes globisporus]